jgi:hypothetical protein
MSKYGVETADFVLDETPAIVQGLRGEDVATIVKVFFANIEILGVNLSRLEASLKISPLPTNMTYTGDKADISNSIRFMVKKLNNIDTRILKIEGKFNLEQLERKEVITEATKYGILCGKFNFNEKNLSEKFFESFSTEEIVTLKEKFFTEGSKLFTPELIELKPVENKEEIKNTNEEQPKATLRELAKKVINGGNSK